MIRAFMLALAVVAVPTLAFSSSAESAEIVKYRCKDWKAKHIHEVKNAAVIVKTLKKLKCEVKESKHNGHIDVSYRCEKWTSLELKTHEEAHKWEKWLKEYSFETKHEH